MPALDRLGGRGEGRRRSSVRRSFRKHVAGTRELVKKRMQMSPHSYVHTRARTHTVGVSFVLFKKLIFNVSFYF